jgi:hypothetical protein
MFIPMTLGNILGGYIYAYDGALPWVLQSIMLVGALILTHMWLRDPEKAHV